MSLADFTFKNPVHILFGKDRVAKNLGKELKANNATCVLLCYGKASIKKSGLYDQVIKVFKDNGIKHVECSGVRPNPELVLARKGIQLARDNNCDFALSVGGGSIIDHTKAVCAGFYYEGDVWDIYERFMGKGKKKVSITKTLPFGTILTLAATGSEMNNGSVLSNDKTNQKLFFNENRNYPRFSILDPTWTTTVSRWQTQAGGYDVMMHTFEQYFSATPRFLTDRISEGLLKTMIHYIPMALKNPDSYEARSNIMWCSSLALNGLLSTGKKNTDWATHWIEHEASVIKTDFSHGIGLAIISLGWMRNAAKTRPQKFCTLGQNVFGMQQNHLTANEFALEVIQTLEDFMVRNGIPVRFTQVYKDFSKENCKTIAKRIGDHYGYPIGSYVKLDEQQVTDLLIDRL